MFTFGPSRFQPIAALSGGPGVTAFAWNPADADTHDNFANSNRDFTGTTGASQLASARTTAGKSSGKWYCEITLLAPTSTDPFAIVGVCDGTFAVTSDFIGNGNKSAGYYYQGQSTLSSTGVTQVNPVSSVPAVNNDVVQLAMDVDAGKAWMGLNGSWLATGNPAAGTNPWITWSPGGTWFFAASNFNSAPVNLRLAAAAAFSPPTGFTSINP
jgi:hypothetical protein